MIKSGYQPTCMQFFKMSAYGKKKRADEKSFKKENEDELDENMSSDDENGSIASDDQFVGTVRL